MLIDRIYLRNYRVYEEELDLELPPGLVGVYGPNGAGKSTLLEAVLWALWGRTRTAKEEVRSAGAHGECVAEVTFEHEGHIYVVRRTISGAASTVRAQAQCDGQATAEGVRETARYVHSVLGMDDAAFRASVFAEQKQIAAFSSQGPAERRKLVLSLLGVTPLDGARDKARSDARARTAQHEQLRRMLPDLEALATAAADADGRAGALEVAALDEEGAAGAAQAALEAEEAAFACLDQLRQEYEQLVVLGRAARAQADSAAQEVHALETELASLAGAEEALAALGPQAALLPAAERSAQLLAALSQAVAELGQLPGTEAPAEPDEAALATASQAAVAAGEAMGAAQARAKAAEGQLATARQALARAADLASEGDCPLCGQALGQAFAQVQAHRASDLAAAEVELAEAGKELAEAKREAKAAGARLQSVQAQVETARRAYAEWQSAASLRQAALRRVSQALSALAGHDPGAAALGPMPVQGEVDQALARAEEARQVASGAAQECSRLRGRLERRPEAKTALADARRRAAQAAEEVEGLLGRVKALGFDQARLEQARQALAEAQTRAAQAQRAAHQARTQAAAARAEANGEARRLADARAQHDQLAALESESIHLARTAELLNGFRNTIVASVGPRLAVQAADLFAELTDNEYDLLEVDPETYGLKIRDGGIPYDLPRFSGSEVDLANLAMRVAISEHVRLLSGGTVGLLVLDEVFGPLDEERRARMLLALERLRGRFRQILVVTHSTGIKEQLPNAIEVVKKPGRRATARVSS